MNLESLNLQALNLQEVSETSGGAIRIPIPSIIKKLTPAAFAVWVIDNWEDVKKGLVDGWNLE